jgi:hypothetical protein
MEAIRRGTPFTVQVSHDPYEPDGVFNTTEYVLYQNGVEVARAPVSADGVNFQFPSGLAKAGTYTFRVDAVGVVPGDLAASDPVAQVLLPGKPGKPVIVIDGMD